MLREGWVTGGWRGSDVGLRRRGLRERLTYGEVWVTGGRCDGSNCLSGKVGYGMGWVREDVSRGENGICKGTRHGRSRLRDGCNHRHPNKLRGPRPISGHASHTIQSNQTRHGFLLSGWVIYTPHFCRMKRFSKYSIYLDGVHIVLHTCGVFEPRHAFNSILACRAMPSCILFPIARPENGSAGCSLRFPATRDW